MSYADDILICTQEGDFQKHLDTVEKVLQKLIENNLKIKASKASKGLNH